MATWKVSFFVKWFINAAFFYIGWLVCMYQATGPYPYSGPAAVLAILIYHFLVSKEKWPDLILCASMAVVGTLVDSLYVNVGMLTYKGEYAAFPALAPLWITSLWSLYAISINHSLSWLRCNKLFAALMGAAGAVSSYLVGINLDAVTPLWGKHLSLAIIGLIWAIVVPLSLEFGSWLRTKV